MMPLSSLRCPGGHGPSRETDVAALKTLAETINHLAMVVLWDGGIPKDQVFHALYYLELGKTIIEAREKKP